MEQRFPASTEGDKNSQVKGPVPDESLERPIRIIGRRRINPQLLRRISQDTDRVQ